MSKGKKSIDDNFIMSPKSDFVFKYIFGNEKHKDLLIALLSDILVVPEEEFEGIEIINNELIKEFKEDKKGILDVRVRTKPGQANRCGNTDIANRLYGITHHFLLE